MCHIITPLLIVIIPDCHTTCLSRPFWPKLSWSRLVRSDLV